MSTRATSPCDELPVYGETATSAVTLPSSLSNTSGASNLTMLLAIEHSRTLGARYYYPGYAYREASSRLQETCRPGGFGMGRRLEDVRTEETGYCELFTRRAPTASLLSRSSGSAESLGFLRT